MKKYLVSMACALLAAMALNGCAASKEKAARKTEQAAKVEAALAERHYKILVNSMADPSETDGVGTRGLILYEPISSYQEELTKKSKRHIEISVENDNDTLIFMIEVSANGNSSITVRSRRRERISYSGYMMLD